MTIRNALSALAFGLLLSLAATGCASTIDLADTEPTADEQTEYRDEAATAINDDNAESSADDLLKEIESDDE